MIDSFVSDVVRNVVNASDRKAPAELPGAGRPFNPSKSLSEQRGLQNFDVHDPLPTSSAPERRALSTVPSGVSKRTETAPAKAIPDRPNYQRQHASSRLRIINLKGRVPDASDSSLRASGLAAVAGMSPYVSQVAASSNSSPALGALALEASRKAASYGVHPPLPSSPADGSMTSACIPGRCRACSRCSMSPVEAIVLASPDRRSLRLMGESCHPGDSLLVASASRCTLAQLFALDAIMADAAGVAIDVRWSENGGSQFRLLGSGPASVLESTAEKLRSACISNGPWLRESPGEILRRHAHVQSGALLGVGGRSPANIVGVLDAWWSAHPDSGVEAIGMCDGTILFGPLTELSDLTDVISGKTGDDK